MSGLLPDGRFMVDHARSWSQEHWFEFEEPPSVEGLAAQLSRLALRFNGYDKGTEEGGTDEGDKEIAMSRPVGVALLLAGSDSRGPVLYHLDPSGTYLQWRAKAIGKQSDDAEAKLEKVEYKDLSLRDAMALVLEVFEAVLQDDFSTDRVEMSCLDCSSDASAVVSKDDMKTIGAGVGEGVGVGLEHTPFFRRVSKAAMDAIVQDAQKRLSKSNECGEGGGQVLGVPKYDGKLTYPTPSKVIWKTSRTQHHVLRLCYYQDPSLSSKCKLRDLFSGSSMVLVQNLHNRYFNLCSSEPCLPTCASSLGPTLPRTLPLTLPGPKDGL
ncbi:unnamed protein product [Choristocarpus tenellus]